MHSLFAVILVYLAIGLAFFLIMGGPLSREKDVGWLGAFMMSVFWPATLFQFNMWMRWGQKPSWRSGPEDERTNRSGGPSAYRQEGWAAQAEPPRQQQPQSQENVQKASYNQLVFGDDAQQGMEEEIDDDDVEAFIAAQFGHQSAPLQQHATISYKRTGISKTYPAGTIFPDAFIADWKAGFFSTVP